MSVLKDMTDERDHYRERATTHAARIDALQHDNARLRAIETAARAFLDADDAADETPAVATIADLHAARKALCRVLGRGR